MSVSKLFARSSDYGILGYQDMIFATINPCSNQDIFERVESAYIQYMNNALEKLDDRLTWIPSTSEIWYNDVNPDKELPDNFDKWWTDTTNDWYMNGPYGLTEEEFENLDNL